MSETPGSREREDITARERLKEARATVIQTVYDNPHYAWDFYELCLTASRAGDPRAVRLAVHALIEEEVLVRSETDQLLRLNRASGVIEARGDDKELGRACGAIMAFVRERSDTSWRPYDLKVATPFDGNPAAISLGLDYLVQSGELVQDDDGLIRLPRPGEFVDLKDSAPVIAGDWA